MSQSTSGLALRFLLFSLCAVFSVLCSKSDAQQPEKLRTIGFLSETKRSNNADAFVHGLRKLGYLEGKNVSILPRYPMGDPARMAEYATELVRLKVDVILAPGTAVALAAKNATATIPVVFCTVSDAVGSGLVVSLSQPGGNLTGLTQISPDLAAKRLEILKDTIPRLMRVAVLVNRKAAANVNALSLSETHAAAKQFGIQLQTVEVGDPNDLDNAFPQMIRKQARALIVISSPMFLDEAKRIADLAKKHRLPAMYTVNEYVDAGGLMNYGVSVPDLFRRAAVYVDKILKGTKAGDLPVEQPIKFEFLINLKTAKQIGLTIPPNVLARADRVIK